MKLILMILIILSSTIEYAPQAIGQNRKPTVTKQPSQPPKKTPSVKKNTSRTVFTPRKAPSSLSPVRGRKAGMSSRNKSKIYAKEGICFDALDMLTNVHQSSQDSSVEKNWQTLLESIELDNIATPPLVNSPQDE
ncbi:MAG: DUF928 domain-containing protein [Cyanobacteria bacterium P01_D01_bin.116]